MSAYIAKRLILFFPSILGVLVVVFLLMTLMPGDVVHALMGDDGGLTDEQRDKLREHLGIDRPMPVQFAVWLGNLVQGDFGDSLWERRPVRDMLIERLPRTLELTILSASLAVLFGVLLGMISGLRPGTLLDYVVRVFTIGGLSLPSFFLGVLLLFGVLKLLGWLPPLAYEPLWKNPAGNLSHQIMPALVLAYSAAAPIARMTRSQLLEVMHEDYIRTARSKGLVERVVIYRHALKNALLPIVTLSGALVGGLLGGVVIVETIFVIPGMGTGLVDAVTQRDLPVVQAFVLIIALIVLTINLLVDLSYAWIDPRIRFR